MFTDPSLIWLRRKLRNDPSPVEVLLWAHLRGKRLDGYKFRRQHSVGHYVLDFYCSAAKLCVEVDGEEHFLSKERMDRDIRRDQYLKLHGIIILHVTGKDVNENIEGVIERILEVLKTSP